MKIYSLIPVIILLSVAANKCKNKKDNNVFKGRLEVKGICMNYTIKLLEGNLDTSKVVSEWKNEVTGKTHNNVFALGSVCGFPSTINEGDEFYFAIDSTYVSNCAVCLAYYPKPAKSLAIKVMNK
ncbi:MAG TPA: hypothetical protein VJ765_03950 [Chitinophagaceae bacterium]|nr:hypothetical protein [Chitinophagaceae bacterium]